MAGDHRFNLLVQSKISELAVNAGFRFWVCGVRDGWNEVLVINGNHQRATAAQRRTNSVKIVSIELAVRAQETRDWPKPEAVVQLGSQGFRNPTVVNGLAAIGCF